MMFGAAAVFLRAISAFHLWPRRDGRPVQEHGLPILAHGTHVSVPGTRSHFSVWEWTFARLDWSEG